MSQYNQSQQVSHPNESSSLVNQSNIIQVTQQSRIDPPPDAQEMWKSLESQGFPNYEISTFGRVKNIKTNYILNGSKDSHGYIRVQLTQYDGTRIVKYVHNLVAIISLPNPDNKKTVDHIDRIRDNNYLNNLRWATPTEQVSNRSQYHVIGRAIYQYSLDNMLIHKWDSLSDAARHLGIVKTSISLACSGKNLTAGGYKWKYCDQVDIIDGEEWRPIPYPEYSHVQVSSCSSIIIWPC